MTMTRFHKSWLLGAAAFAATALTADPASAAFTIDFGSGSSTGGGPNSVYSEDGFNFTPGQIQNSANCPGTPPCLLGNQGALGSVDMTFDGGVFDLLGFSFDITGQEGTISVSGDPSGSATFTDPPGGAIAFSGGEFADVTQITFTYTGGGTLRIDDVVATPLPAAAWMFLAGLGVVGGVIGRRRRAAAAAA